MGDISSLKKRINQIENAIPQWQKIIDSAPEGRLISRKRSADKYEYSISVVDSDGKKKESFIPASSKDMAEKLALKEYAKKILQDCIKEKNILQNYIDFYSSDKKAVHYLSSHPGAAELILPKLYKDKFAEDWSNMKYIRSTSHSDMLKYQTIIPGLKVRSKAEADIVSRFTHYSVPFRYEEEHNTGGEIFHPDFTCLNVRTHDIFYWEHLGRIDDSKYFNDLFHRQKLHRSAGMIPWKNLLLTTETLDQPLDILWVDTIIQYFLL